MEDATPQLLAVEPGRFHCVADLHSNDRACMVIQLYDHQQESVSNMSLKCPIVRAREVFRR